MLYATLIVLVLGLGSMVLMWLLVAPPKRTIIVAGKERRWVVETRWAGRGSVPVEVAAYFLTDSQGEEFRVTKGTYLEANVGHSLAIAQRGEYWTSSFASAGEPDETSDGPVG